MKGIDLNLLPALDALLQTRNVTKAARTMGYSQPTMSGILARLRTQFQDPLLVRVGRAMELTPRAVGLEGEIRQILLALEKLAPPPPGLDTVLQRTFTIMTSEFGLFLLLPKLFRQVAVEHPGISFRAVTIDQPVDSVFNGVADLCLTGDRIDMVNAEAAQAVRVRTLMHDDFLAVVDRAHPLPARATLDDVARFPRISAHFSGMDYAAEDVVRPGLSAKHPPVCRVPSFLAIAQMVVGTHAVGLVPSRLADHLVDQQLIRTVPLSEEFEPIALKMLWHSRFEHEPAHAWLRAALIGIAAPLQRAGAGRQFRAK